MPEVRFDVVYNPGDGLYRTVDYFRDYQNLDEFNIGAQKTTILRTPFGCMTDKAGRYHPELATRWYNTDNTLAAVDIRKTETQIIKRKIKELEIPDLGREPALRSHARGLMSRFNMDKLDGIDVRKVLENNPVFYSKGYKEEDDTVLDEGEAVVTYTDRDGRDIMTRVSKDGEAKKETLDSGKPKTSVKMRLKNFFRRLCCVPLQAEEKILTISE